MIEVLADFPDDVLAVAAHDQVTADDYRNVLMPLALEKMKKHKHVRVLCHLGPDFRSFAAGAMWEDTKLLVGHWGVWGRIAIVTDKTWVAEAVRMFAPFFRYPVRVFGNDAITEAKAWLLEPEAKAA